MTCNLGRNELLVTGIRFLLIYSQLDLMKSFHIALFVVLSACVQAQVIGKPFPVMETENLSDQRIVLPDAVRGKYTLLGLAYSKKSEDELNSWFQPVFEKFIQKNKGLFEGFGYDVYVYFIPMFTGVNAAATGTAKKKAIQNVDPQLQPYILFYKGELKPYKDALDFEKRDVPYFFVLDADGIIRYATTGKYSPAKMDAIEAVLE